MNRLTGPFVASVMRWLAVFGVLALVVVGTLGIASSLGDVTGMLWLRVSDADLTLDCGNGIFRVITRHEGPWISDEPMDTGLFSIYWAYPAESDGFVMNGNRTSLVASVRSPRGAACSICSDCLEEATSAEHQDTTGPVYSMWIRSKGLPGTPVSGMRYRVAHCAAQYSAAIMTSQAGRLLPRQVTLTH